MVGTLGDIDANAVYAAAVRRCERFSHLIEREHGALVVEDEHFAFAQVHEIVAVIAIDVHGVVGGSSRRSWLKDIEGGKAGFVAGKPIVSGGYISAYAIYPCGIIAICVGGFAGIAEVARLDSIELSAVEGSAAYKTEVCSGLPIQEFLLAYGRAVVLVFLTEVVMCVPGIVCVVKRCRQHSSACCAAAHPDEQSGDNCNRNDNARFLLFGANRCRWGSGSRRDEAPLGSLLEVGACLCGSVAIGGDERCLLGRCAVLHRHSRLRPHGWFGRFMVRWLLGNIAGTGRLRWVAPVVWIGCAGHGQPFWWCCLHMLNGMPL